MPGEVGAVVITVTWWMHTLDIDDLLPGHCETVTVCMFGREGGGVKRLPK